MSEREQEILKRQRIIQMENVRRRLEEQTQLLEEKTAQAKRERAAQRDTCGGTE
jgi:hypothetical protein